VLKGTGMTELTKDEIVDGPWVDVNIANEEMRNDQLTAVTPP